MLWGHDLVVPERNHWVSRRRGVLGRTEVLRLQLFWLGHDSSVLVLVFGLGVRSWMCFRVPLLSMWPLSPSLKMS